MKIYMDVDVNETEFNLIRTHSLERVLKAVLNVRTREEFIAARAELAELAPLASQLWYVASGSTPIITEDG